MTESVFQAALAVLECCDVEAKCQGAGRLLKRFLANELTLDAADPPKAIPEPGRPGRPELVSPRDLPRRGLASREGRAAFIHALAHIEFNAINLALDAAYRFRGLPWAFYRDWLTVAAEEARHFQLLQARLRELGSEYGDFPAHNGLWDMAVKTDDDVLKRMALGPRLFEARGLDVTPGMMKRLKAVGDFETAACLKVIYEDEIGHVRMGSEWFVAACRERGVEPEAEFLRLVKANFPRQLRGELNHEARLAAGFSRDELASFRGV
ncbi:MAG TPA: ferritin-like domain-containing protein [Gammaproteobacteria bacterium]|nr:ferritin-like domain-containing protein [Gammaproteobacteria bacterium]